MTKAPVALFAFQRLDHLQRTVDSLLANAGAEATDVVVFSDAARVPQQQERVQGVRDYARTIRGFRSVRVVERATNFGLARSIVDGVGHILASSDTVIVVEDDMVTSPHFLRYMNEGLERFAQDERVISVHGYVYPVARPLPEAFFLRGADCWGWATWRRGWRLFNRDGQALLDELSRRKLLHAFDFNGSHPYTQMLRNQIAGRNDSWAIRWYASAFLADKLTLYPGRSLVHNIGNDNSGTHAENSDTHDAVLSATPIDLRDVPVQHSAQAHAAFEAFFRRSVGTLWQRAMRHARQAVARLAA